MTKLLNFQFPIVILQLYNPLDTSLIPSKSPSPDISTSTVTHSAQSLKKSTEFLPLLFNLNNLLSTAKMPRNTSSRPVTYMWTCHVCSHAWFCSTTPSCFNCQHPQCSSCTVTSHVAREDK